MGQNKFFRLLNSNWTVTLLSTMIGIILGLYLTNLFQESVLLKEKAKALVQVVEELENNEKTLETYQKSLSAGFQSLNYFLTKLNEGGEIVIPKDSISSFERNAGPFFTLDSTEIRDAQNVVIRGDYDLNIQSPLMVRGLSDVVWKAYKQAGFIGATQFKCLRDLETVYSLQEEVDQVNAVWRNAFWQGRFMKDIRTRSEFMESWRVLLEKQEILLQIYGSLPQMLENCD